MYAAMELTAESLVGRLADDDEERPGRVLSVEEFTRRVCSRADIFALEDDTRLSKLTVVSLMLGAGLGVLMANYQQDPVPVDFPTGRLGPATEGQTRLHSAIERVPAPEKPTPQAQVTPRRVQRPTVSHLRDRGTGMHHSQAGDPRTHVIRTGVLALVSGRIIGRTVANASFDGPGGFARDIDAVIQGIGALRGNGSPGVGRTGISSMGFGPGYGPSDGGASVNDLIDDLARPIEIASPVLKQRTVHTPLVAPDNPAGRLFVGGRSKAEIFRVVNQNLGALRYAYTVRLREMPGLRGKITVKFAIDEFGNVVACDVTESSIRDEKLEKTVVDKIRRWKFERLDKPGDITQVVYPFVFSL
jgi:TonB family protein